MQARRLPRSPCVFFFFEITTSARNAKFDRNIQLAQFYSKTRVGTAISVVSSFCSNFFCYFFSRHGSVDFQILKSWLSSSFLSFQNYEALRLFLLFCEELEFQCHFTEIRRFKNSRISFIDFFPLSFHDVDSWFSNNLETIAYKFSPFFLKITKRLFLLFCEELEAKTRVSVSFYSNSTISSLIPSFFLKKMSTRSVKRWFLNNLETIAHKLHTRQSINVLPSFFQI